MLGAIVCGAYFGDNIAPVSDTTIASSYTQGAEVSSVVKSRLVYALTAALIACVLFVIFGSGSSVPIDTSSLLNNLSPKGLVMLAVPIILIFMMFRGSNLIVAMMSTGAFGILLAIVSGLLSPKDLLIIDMNSFTVSGLIVNGINSLMDIAIFAFLLMGLVGILDSGGLFEMIMEKTKNYTKTPRSAEAAITIITIILNVLTVASTIVIIMVGPLTKKMLHEHKIVPERRANILDAVSAAVMCLIPYAFGPLLAYMFAGSSGVKIDFSLISIIPYMFHGWALLGVMIYEVVTGHHRTFMDEESYLNEKVAILSDNN
jgi:Na+/H+ antiporter NhaC